MAFASTDFQNSAINCNSLLPQWKFYHPESLYGVVCFFVHFMFAVYSFAKLLSQHRRITLCFLISISSNNGLTTKNLTPEQRQQIINECVEDMISPTDLARKWNCNADTIRTWVRKAGLTLPKQYKKSIYPDSGSAPARAMGYGHHYHHILRKTLPGQFKYAHT